MTATVRSCLAAGVAVLTAVALAGVPGDSGWPLAAPVDGVTGGDRESSDAAVSLEAARRSGKPVRVDSLTSATTEVWAQPDGDLRAEISAGVQRFRRDGGWVPVDLTLRPTGDGGVEPVAHPGGLRLAGARGDGSHELAAIGTGADRIAMNWSGALPAPELAGHRATYVDVMAGVDLVVEATRVGFAQSLVVKDRTAVERVRRVVLPLTGSGAAGASRDGDGVITLTGGSGAETARIPAPLMWDARRNAVGSPAVERLVDTTAEPRGAGVDLVLTPDLDWLRDPSTVYPVTIDPTVNPTVTFDTWVQQADTTNRSGANDLRLGVLASTPPAIARSFLEWNSAVLTGKQINSATVSFWNFWSHTCDPVSWEIWSTGAANTSTRFTNQPAWNHHEATSTATMGGADCADAWVTIDGKSFFQRAADVAGSTRAWMGLRATDETVPAGFKQFRSIEGTLPAEDPKATVVYNSWPTVTARSTVPASTCATGATRPLVNSLTPQLRATVSDGDGTAMSVMFEWWALDGSVPIGSTTFTGVASGATAATTVPAGAFADGGRYKWRVKAADGVAGSDRWSSFCEMTVYVTAPPQDCGSGVDNDFNGDGVADVVIADPEATVDGQERSGQLHVVYGGTGTTQAVHGGNAQVSGSAQAGDGFGTSVAAYDANNDGCTDLAVGVPYRDVAGSADAGTVYVLFGSPAGLANGPASLTLRQGAGGVPDSAEAEDWFGFAVAAGRTATGEAYLVIGAPGEDIGSAVDTGLVHYRRGTVNVAMQQSGGGLAGSNENDDRVGYSVAGSPYHFAVGSPGESIGTNTFAGNVHVFSHELVSGLPKSAVTINQDTAGVSGVAEVDDQFGKSVSLAAYRPAGAPAGQADSFLVVGSPGEDLALADGTFAPDAGLIYRFHITAAGTLNELPTVSYRSVDGNYAGEQVLVVNTDPASVATDQTLFIAFGAPGVDLDGATDAGRVMVFPALAPSIGTPVTISRTTSSLPGPAVGGELLGIALGATKQHLYVASPYRERAVYAHTWTDIANNTATPAHVWRAGEAGLPAGGVAFGAAVG
ncbi:DNRLRE domain-containing protein [Polymorphospora rubra]|uniref:DNRLRE domain-containing protein n=1 Tax=Polymorphospora rubra TaxID=338584 RepID=UPI0033EEF9FB